MTLLVVPKGFAQAEKNIDFLNIHNHCQKSPDLCLIMVNKTLPLLKEQSRVWFDLMQYKLDSLFILQKSEELYALTQQWIDNESFPIPFQISVYIYYAKSIVGETAKLERKKYIDKAITKLSLMNEVYPNPMLLIQLANIKMRAGDYVQAFDALKLLEAKYLQLPDPMFQLDLNGNLAHLSDKLSFKSSALTYWKKALKWAFEFKNDQQIATVYYNFAHSQVNSNLLIPAETNFNNAITFAQKANDHSKLAQAKLYLTRLKVSQNLPYQAKNIFQKIKIKHLVASDLEELEKLQLFFEDL